MTHAVAAVIPFYNNRATVDAVAEAVAGYIPDVILVNDGSTDGSEKTIRPRKEQVLLHHEKNRGKGAAVKTAAGYALSKGFTHILQIDGDGQHDPSEIPSFLSFLSEHDDVVIAGYRKFTGEEPFTSRFGRVFGNMWFRIETLGYPVLDTQCGYRLYPLSLFRNLKSLCNRMDFDVEILILALERGMHIINHPVSVRYFHKEDRVTHYRLLRDNLLMSRLHFIKTWSLLVRWPQFRFMVRSNPFARA